MPQAQEWVGWYRAIEDLLPSLPETKLAQWQVSRLGTAFEKEQAREGGLWAESAIYRALLIESKNANQQYGDGLREYCEPAMTVNTDGKPSHQPKALLIDVANTIRDCTVREENKPSFTVTAEKMRRPASTPKVILESAKVLQMSSRCLARFQTLPDWYELPTKNNLACKGIGNGVPCKFAETIVRSLIGGF
jgi:site-specific DNA-cytosine methylase